MVAQQWRKIGIYGDVKQMERGLGVPAATNNQDQIDVWNNGGTELLYLFPRLCPAGRSDGSAIGPGIAKWYASGGTQGTEPTDPNIEDLGPVPRGGRPERDGRNKTAQEIWKIIVEQQYLDRHGRPVAGAVWRAHRSAEARQYPERICIAQHCRTPGISHPETWFFKA